MSDLPPDVAARLEQARQDAIRASREGVLLTRRPLRPEEEPRSYLGGLPHLREDLEWPVSTENGRPFTFIAQIDLRDVPRPAGAFFPAEGLLWFFVDTSEGEFTGEHKTRVLFDPHPRTMDREREAPAGLPPLDPYDHERWRLMQHPRAFVVPKAGLLLDLVDTFYDRPYRPPATWEDFFRIVLTPWRKREKELDELTFFAPGVYSEMIGELRQEAFNRAIGKRATDGGDAWWFSRTGCREAHWPPTSILRVPAHPGPSLDARDDGWGGWRLWGWECRSGYRKARRRRRGSMDVVYSRYGFRRGGIVERSAPDFSFAICVSICRRTSSSTGMIFCSRRRR